MSQGVVHTARATNAGLQNKNGGRYGLRHRIMEKTEGLAIGHQVSSVQYKVASSPR